MKKNSIKQSFIYILSLLAVVSCLQEERSPEDILIPSPAQVDCSASSFSLTSKVPNGSEKLVDECGFLVGTAKDMADAVTVEGTMTANSFAAELPMRKYGATYYICSYVTNGHGSEIRSDVSSFALESLDKYVKFGAVTVSSYDMASKTTELSLAADIWAGVEVSEAGLCYGESEVLSLEGYYAAGSLADDGAIYITINGFIDGDKYYLRPYLRDGEYLAYGDVVEFSIPAVPVVKTYDAAEVTSEGAVLSGEVVKGADISERGFMLAEGESSAADMGRKIIVEGSIGGYTTELSALQPNQKYTFCAYAINPSGTYYGDEISFVTEVGMPKVSAPVISSITSVSAIFSSVVTDHGGENVSEVGFYYSTNADFDSALKVNQPYATDAYSLEVSDLEINTKYYVRAYVRNSTGVVCSDVESFKTSVYLPSVTTLAYTDVTSMSALLSGDVISDNGSAITERGFVWIRGTGAPTIESYKIKVEGTTGEYTGVLTGLEPNERYSFRAYAINSEGVSYGEIMYFFTLAGLPELSITTVTEITSTSAVLSCTIVNNGGATVSEVGFYYDVVSQVDIQKSSKHSEDYSSDTFSVLVENLKVGTNYYVKAYAVNDIGEKQNDVVLFKTISTIPSVVTDNPLDIESHNAKLTGSVTSDNGEPITDRGFVWMPGIGTPTISNNVLKVSGSTGKFSVILESLEPVQVYSYRAYAINSKGIAYGEIRTFETKAGKPAVEVVEFSDITSSAAKVSCVITDKGGDRVTDIGIIYGTSPDLNPSFSDKVSNPYTSDSFSYSIKGLSRAQSYYVQPFATNSVGTYYGEISTFKTLPEIPIVITSEVTEINDNSAVSGGAIVDDGGESVMAKGLVWSKFGTPTLSDFNIDNGVGNSSFENKMTNLESGTTYYVRAYATNSAGTAYGPQRLFTTTGDIQTIALEASNSFIISQSDIYSFKPVKGNSFEPVGDIASVDVLWESYGTYKTPTIGSLISQVSYSEEKIVFVTAYPFVEGNAVIAAKNQDGEILWSWHIWLTDKPQEQIYTSDAMIMMDRNLGALSSTAGDVGALGLLYQWGRKDPFMGSSSIDYSSVAASTIIWPSIKYSDYSIGTIEFVVANPTTFISYNNLNYDWYYTGTETADNSRWQSNKTIYDPCPAGWRVPDSEVWKTSLFDSCYYDQNNRGIKSNSELWYPIAGYRSSFSGALQGVCDHGMYNDYDYGCYWSVTNDDSSEVEILEITKYGISVGLGGPVETTGRASAYSVRCQKE